MAIVEIGWCVFYVKILNPNENKLILSDRAVMIFRSKK
jgi:hypothetical protein